MSDQLIDLLENKTELTEEQKIIMHLTQGHITLQDQFNQLTQHVEVLYTRINELNKLVQSKVLS